MQQGLGFEQHRAADDARSQSGSQSARLESAAARCRAACKSIAVAGLAPNGLGQIGFGHGQLGPERPAGRARQASIGQVMASRAPRPAAAAAGQMGRPARRRPARWLSAPGRFQPQGGSARQAPASTAPSAHKAASRQSLGQQGGGGSTGASEGGSVRAVGQHPAAAACARQRAAAERPAAERLASERMPAHGMPAGRGGNVASGPGLQSNGPQPRGGSLGAMPANGMPGSHGGLPPNGSPGRPGVTAASVRACRGTACPAPARSAARWHRPAHRMAALTAAGRVAGRGQGGDGQGASGSAAHSPRERRTGTASAQRSAAGPGHQGRRRAAGPIRSAAAGSGPASRASRSRASRARASRTGPAGSRASQDQGQPVQGQPAPGQQGMQQRRRARRCHAPPNGMMPLGRAAITCAAAAAAGRQRRAVRAGQKHALRRPGAAGPVRGPGGAAGTARAPTAASSRPRRQLTMSVGDAVQSAHAEGFGFGEAVARDAPALWLEAVLARKPRMPSDLEARLLQGSALPIDSLLHDEVRHALAARVLGRARALAALTADGRRLAGRRVRCLRGICHEAITARSSGHSQCDSRLPWSRGSTEP